MQITILKLSKTKSVNPMKAILTLSKYLKLGIPDAKGIVASLPADLNVGTLDENELNELIAALTACGIQAALTPLRLPSEASLSTDTLSAYLHDLCKLEAQIILCKGILNSQSASCSSSLLSKRIHAVSESLDRLYSFNILAFLYRKLISVCQFIDYLDSGKCSQLEGPEGAYALFEEEIRQHKITNLMHTALQDYETLSLNQPSLFSVMQKAKAAKDALLTQEDVLRILEDMKAEEQMILEKYKKS